MNEPALVRHGWRAAILSGVVTLLMLITAVLSTRLHLGNTFSVLVLALMLLIALVAWTLHLRLGARLPITSLAAAVVGTVGCCVIGAAHIFLISGASNRAQFNTLGEGVGPAAIGIWLLLANYVAWRSGVVPRVLTLFGLVAGAGYFVSGIGALITGQVSEGTPNVLSSVGPLGIFLVYPLWAVWLGFWMRKGAAVKPTWYARSPSRPPRPARP